MVTTMTDTNVKGTKDFSDDQRIVLKLNGYLLQLSEAIVNNDKSKAVVYRGIIDSLLEEAKHKGLVIILHKDTHRYRLIHKEQPKPKGDTIEQQEQKRVMALVEASINAMYTERTKMLIDFENRFETKQYSFIEFVNNFDGTIRDIMNKNHVVRDLEVEIDLLKTIMDGLSSIGVDVLEGK